MTPSTKKPNFPPRKSLGKLAGLNRAVNNQHDEASPALNASPTSTPERRIEAIPVDEIVSKAQPRVVFEKIEELAESLAEQGQQTPIIVERREDGKYLIEQGERRWRAARLAGLETLDCIVREPDPEDTEEKRTIRQITENIQREDMKVWELAQSVSALIAGGLTGRELARRLGKDETTISLLNSIAHLPEPLDTFVKEERVKNPLAVRRLLKLFQQDPKSVRKQIRKWSRADDLDAPVVITREDVKKLAEKIARKAESQADASVEESGAAAAAGEVNPTEGELPRAEEAQGRLPKGCQSINSEHLLIEVEWQGLPAFIPMSILPPDGKVCLLMAATGQKKLVDPSEVSLKSVRASDMPGSDTSNQ